MTYLRTPRWLSEHQFVYNPATPPLERIEKLRDSLSRFRIRDPETSIIMPAYNEQSNLLHTLSSLAGQQSARRIELIVVNNNSSDATQELLDQCGVRSVTERQSGVAFARQTGLEMARGRFVANADADCLYPPGWVDSITNGLQHPAVGCTYGLYSFLPSPHTFRSALACYELVSHSLNLLRSRKKPYLNVYGFNFAFRREDALAIGGFDLDTGPVGSVAELVASGKIPLSPMKRGEDGWMALSLAREGKGTICRVTNAEAHVWTSGRRLAAHGGLRQAFWDRAKQTVLDYISSSR